MTISKHFIQLTLLATYNFDVTQHEISHVWHRLHNTTPSLSSTAQQHKAFSVRATFNHLCDSEKFACYFSRSARKEMHFF